MANLITTTPRKRRKTTMLVALGDPFPDPKTDKIENGINR